MSEAANIINVATQVPEIARSVGIGAGDSRDLQLANRYQFSSILRHLGDTPEKTLEAAKGPEKDPEPLVRPKTVEDNRDTDSDRHPHSGDNKGRSEEYADQTVSFTENRSGRDDQASADNRELSEPAATRAPASDDSSLHNTTTPDRSEFVPFEGNVDDFVAAILAPVTTPQLTAAPVVEIAATTGTKLATLFEHSSAKPLDINPSQVTSKTAQTVLSSALTDQQFTKIGEDLHNAVQAKVKEVIEAPKPQAAGNLLKTDQEQTLSQKLGLAQALSVHVDKGIDSTNNRLTPLHTLTKGAHLAQLDPSSEENFISGNNAKGNGENISSDRKAPANHGAVSPDRALSQTNTADPSTNFGQMMRIQAAMTGIQHATAAASMGAKVQPVTLDASNLNGITGSNGPSQISQTEKANPLTAARQPERPPVPVEQVAVNIKNAIGEGVDKINIKLHPAQLGRVEVRMEIAKDGQLSAVILAEKPETLDMLRGDVRGLERALQEAGLKTDSGSLNFGLKSQNPNTAETGRDGEDTHSGHQNDHGHAPDGNQGNGEYNHPGVYGQNQSRNGGIDIRV